MSVTLTGIKDKQRTTWSSGDYAQVGARLQLMSELLCEAVDLQSSERVLDVACGSGNTAIAAARRFCEVTGVDYVPGLLDTARRRAEAEGLEVSFIEGDAEDIPAADASYDAVLSTVGVMFAPDQERAASELLRVCRSGGRIGLSNWTPEGFVGQLFRVVGAHVPPPAGLKPPSMWGTEERIRELFDGEVTDVRVTRRTHVFRYPSPQFFVDFFRTYYGPTLKAFDALDEEGREALARDMRELAEQLNTSGGETAVHPSEYIEVVATRR